ncbi:MAG: choline-sulfatase, partial [Pseudomonadota bacterium]
ADQLHGFEERLTTEIYPCDFGWTPDYRKPGERIDWWYHNMGSVTGAGVAEITNQMEYDDEVAFLAEQKLYDLARGHDTRPWCLTVSFTHPHDPYVARRRFWDLYEDCPALEPTITQPATDAHSQRILDANDRDNFTISDEDIRRSRRAYFANISYLDEKIGALLQILEDTRQEASIVFVSDHGDMLGEHGLWFKMSFREGSARVPLMIASPDLPPGRIDTPVSTLDIVPTLAGLAGIDLGQVLPYCEGVDLAAVASGTERGPVPMEYAAEATISPLVGLVEGTWKYTNCALDPEQLFDLAQDPHELIDLAEDPGHAATLEHFRVMAAARWDLEAFDSEVRASQDRRWVVYDALRQGHYTAWDYAPPDRSDRRFMRNDMDLNEVEERQRFPRGE